MNISMHDASFRGEVFHPMKAKTVDFPIMSSYMINVDCVGEFHKLGEDDQNLDLGKSKRRYKKRQSTVEDCFDAANHDDKSGSISESIDIESDASSDKNEETSNLE